MITHEEANKMLDEVLEKIGEHFEAVQILASNSDASGTRSYSRGCGNFFARIGTAQRFLKIDESEDAAHVLSKILNDEDQSL